MKKLLSVFIALCVALTTMPIIVFAKDDTVPVIDVVKICNATIDIKAGDEPVFTAESAEPDLYSTRLDTIERWTDVETGAYITSSKFYNDRIEPFGDTRIDEFIAGHTYAYSIGVQAIDPEENNHFSCGFTEDTNIEINGEYYLVSPENKSLEGEDFFGVNYQIFFSNITTITVQSHTTVDIRIGNKTFKSITGNQTIIVDSLDLSDITVLKQNGVDVEGASDEWSMSTKYLDSQNRGVLEVQTAKKTSDSVTFNLVSHYSDCAGADFEDFQIMFITAHMHKYTNKITPAKTDANGKIVPTCSCGKTKSATTIYKVSTVKLNYTSLTYNGKTRSVGVTVKDSKGKALTKGTDYTVSWDKTPKNVGVYTCTVKFKGKYTGSKKLTLKVNPAATTLSSVSAQSKALTPKWKKQATQTTGYEIQCATDSKFTKNKKTVTVSNTKTTSKKVTGLKAKTKYYVRVRTYKTVKVNGKSTKLYSGWSKVKTVTTKK